MRIHFERAGGLAPAAMKKTCTVDTANLPADEAREVEGLLKAVDFADLAARSTAFSGRSRERDGLLYRITVEDGDQKHTIQASDGNMPPALRPLIGWMEKRTSR
jgi:hypothetical protein